MLTRQTLKLLSKSNNSFFKKSLTQGASAFFSTTTTTRNLRPPTNFKVNVVSNHQLETQSLSSKVEGTLYQEEPSLHQVVPRQKYIELYEKLLKERFDNLKPSDNVDVHQDFFEKVVPEFFKEARKLGLPVNIFIVQEVLAHMVAYTLVKPGWKFEAEVDEEVPRKYTFTVASTLYNNLDGEAIASSTPGVAPVPGGMFLEVSHAGTVKATYLVLTGTSSVGAGKPKVLEKRISGAFSDADKEIGRGFIEDERTWQWILKCINAHPDLVLFVSGQSLGAGGAQLVCRKILEEGLKDPELLYGIFFSPPSPSRPPPKEWMKYAHRFYFIGNSSDPVFKLGGAYRYAGWEFVLAWSATPLMYGSQNVFIDLIGTHHGTLNIIFALISGAEVKFVLREVPSFSSEPPSIYDFDSLPISELLSESVDILGRQNIAHRGFKWRVSEEVVTCVDHDLKLSKKFYPPNPKMRGHRLAALVQLIEALESFRLPIPVKELIECFVSDFGSKTTLLDALYNSETKEKAIDAIYVEISDSILLFNRSGALEDAQFETSLLAARWQETLKETKFKLTLSKAVMETASLYKKGAYKELSLLERD